MLGLHLALMSSPVAIPVVPLELIAGQEVSQRVHENARRPPGGWEEAPPADVRARIVVVHPPRGMPEPFVPAVHKMHLAGGGVTSGCRVVRDTGWIAHLVLCVCQELAGVCRRDGVHTGETSVR